MVRTARTEHKIVNDSMQQVLASAEATGSTESPVCLAVMYHYVQDRDTTRVHGIHHLSTKSFRDQLEELCRVFEPVDWPHLYAWSQERQKLPSRSFLLTFDDGLADHHDFVSPILEEMGLRGTFFVPGAVLTERRMLPAHAIHLLLATLDATELLAGVTERLAVVDSKTDWQAAINDHAAQKMYDYESAERAQLKYFLTITLPVPIRNDVVDFLFEKHIGASARWADKWYMNWDDLCALQSAGHTIGGHGFSHEPYLRLSRQDQQRDAQRVAEVLNEGWGVDLRPFSFPYGSHNEQACKACSDAGFVHAFTTKKGLIASGDQPMCLPRIDTIHVDSVIEGVGQ